MRTAVRASSGESAATHLLVIPTIISVQQPTARMLPVTARLTPGGLDLLTKSGVGRAMLLLSRIASQNTAPIPAAPQKHRRKITARIRVRWLGRSLGRPGRVLSVRGIPENCKTIRLKAAVSSGSSHRKTELVVPEPAMVAARIKFRWECLSRRNAPAPYSDTEVGECPARMREKGAASPI